jgi:tetratricopeptide (TPR) repeat protein
MHRLLLALCLVTVAAPATEHVAYADDPGERSAKRHYDRGKKLFGLQKFEEALEQFQKAYDASPIPDFLFNIGQCQRNLGDYEAAIFSFKRFLKLDPETEKREKVEELIDDLQRKIDEGNTERLKLGTTKKKQKPEKDLETEGSPVYKKWWFWTGIAVVGVGVGAGLYLATKSSAPDTDLGNIEFRRIRAGQP